MTRRSSLKLKTAAWIAGVAVLMIAVAFLSCANCAEQSQLTQEKPRPFDRSNLASVNFQIGPVIPGLRQGAVPQGITYDAASSRILISNYFEKRPSSVSILDGQSGRLVSTVTLKDSSGTPHEGHAGGIAVAGKSLFVASDGRVLQYELPPFARNSPPASLIAKEIHECETEASFCTATDELLLVGEFAYGRDYPTDSSHHLKDRKGVRKYAWVCGYRLAESLGKPHCVLSVRQRVQGMCVWKNRVFLSVSYGRRNRSRIVVYRNPIGEPAHRQVKVKGETVPLWFLDGENFLGEIDFPPMSEGIAMINGRLAVLSESGAEKYQSGGRGPLDTILSLDVSQFR
jgi:hypothetical protein